MADLDAELLALAGGDSSDDEGTKPTTITTKPVSPPSSASASAAYPIDALTSKVNATPKTSSKSHSVARATKKSKPNQNDSEEEGEASSTPASPNSLQSAPMSESESDASPAVNADTDGPMFPLENKFYDEKDKETILSLSEIQRESILAERAHIHERKLQDLHLRRLLQARENAESRASDKKKRKAGNADLEDGQRKSSRQKTTLGGRKVGETSDAMKEYRRQLEQKGLRDEQRRRDGEERKDRKGHGSVHDAYSDADADGESEVEWDDTKPREIEHSVRDDQPAELIDFERVRIGRDNFAKVCFYPKFDDAIKNCFVRISIGPDKATGENVYRVAQIKGFTEGRPYAMDGTNGKPFTTKQYALVAVGKSQKEWPFLACSNSRFTEAEFNRYKVTVADEELTLPTKSYLISKIDDINNLLNHQFTEEEIQEKLTKSGVLKNRFASIERAAIAARRKTAVDRGDEAAIAKLDAELAALDGPKLAFGTSLRKAPPKPMATPGLNQQERLALLNRANRKANTQDVRKAQHAERKAEALARKAVERGEAVQNPFARVKTRAKVHHDVNGDALAVPSSSRGLDDLFEGNSRDISRSGTPLSVGESKSPMPAGTPKRSGTPLNGGEKISGLPRIGKRNMDDDVFAAMDFGIEIDI